ncbi:MAG: PEP-CTERM sorting domain-containing protein [Gammaproteobacteria bacterium]
MKTIKYYLALALFCSVMTTTNANAVPVFVGSWEVADGPTWSALGLPPFQPAYSALEAAALLFGGSPTDYVISTVSALVADINFSAWYDGYGIGMGILAQDFDNGDLYTPDVRSAYIHDNSCFEKYNNPNAACTSDDFRNFAFRLDGVNVPEPTALALLSLGVFGAGYRLRKQRV